MKIKPLYINKLIKLQILKSRIYKKNINSKLKKKIETNKIQLYLKKITQIIYTFHIAKKRILFLNFPKKMEKKIARNFKQNQHIFIEDVNFLNGIISNRKINVQQSKNSINKIPNKKLIDLIIIFNPISSLNSDKKIFISQIPTITITQNFNNNFNLKQNYKLLGNFKFIEKQNNNNIFFSILRTILKNKGNKTLQKKI